MCTLTIHPDYGKVVETLSIASTEVGKSVYFLDNKIYLGTDNNSVGPELYIINVNDPLNIPAPLASYEIGGAVNDITVTPDGFAYIATNNPSSELLVINLNTGLTASVDLPQTSNHKDRLGQSVYRLGNRLYLGLLDENQPDEDFYIYDITNRATQLLPTQIPGSGLNVSGDVLGIVVSSELAFINTTHTTNEFKVLFDMTPSIDTSSIYGMTQLSNVGDAIDFENNRAYSIGSMGNAVMQVYKPGLWNSDTNSCIPLPPC